MIDYWDIMNTFDNMLDEINYIDIYSGRKKRYVYPDVNYPKIVIIEVNTDIDPIISYIMYNDIKDTLHIPNDPMIIFSDLYTTKECKIYCYFRYSYLIDMQNLILGYKNSQNYNTNIIVVVNGNIQSKTFCEFSHHLNIIHKGQNNFNCGLLFQDCLHYFKKNNESTSNKNNNMMIDNIKNNKMNIDNSYCFKPYNDDVMIPYFNMSFPCDHGHIFCRYSHHFEIQRNDTLLLQWFECSMANNGTKLHTYFMLSEKFIHFLLNNKI